MEVIDIGVEKLDPVSISFNDKSNETINGPEQSSSNLGTGIELLMNDKRRTASSDNMATDLGDLDDLESELNNLTNNATEPVNVQTESKGFAGMASDLFGLGNNIKKTEDTININDDTLDASTANLGSATRDSVGNTRTWDGYGKMNETPKTFTSSNLSEREKRRKKRAMLKKLEEWQDKGHFKMNSHIDMDTSYEEIEDEYETVMDEKRKKDSIKLQGWWFMTFVNSIEYANAVFNPFDLNLDGWGEQISEDIDSYDEIFVELHDKYKGGKMAPELSLLLRLGFSAAVLNFSNKALSTATPGFNDVIKENPELMRMFTDATVNSMSKQSPGFDFANNLMQEQMNNKPRGPPPPAPVETKSQPPPTRPSMQYTEAPSNRPDINAGRGNMFRENGVELNKSGTNINDTAKPIRPTSRPEMKGPQNSDIDDILSGLKTKTVDIRKEENTFKGNDSMISVSSLKDLQNDNIPQKSNRKRNKSDKNVISLDI